MFCIFTTRAEKRHLVQEMLTKNVEHVKMKKSGLSESDRNIFAGRRIQE